MVYIYVLLLEQNKYYVGKTKKPDFRIDKHFNNNGSAWTKKYAPIKVLNIIEDCDDYDEDKYTRIYMDKYGIDNVRGGSFVTIKIDANTKKELTKMSNGTNDRCFICGEYGHFKSQCKSVTRTQQQKQTEKLDTIWQCSYCNKEFKTKNGATFHENVHCKFKNSTNLDYDDESDDSDDSDCCYECEYCNCEVNMSEKKKHEKSCKRKYRKYTIDCSSDCSSDNNDSDEDKKSKNKAKCYRCGRNGHYANKCFASKHIKGYVITK